MTRHGRWRYRAESALRNGTLAHRHASLLAGRGLCDLVVEPHTLTVRDATAVDQVMGLRSWAHSAAERGYLTGAEADAFVMRFDTAVHSGRFRYAVTFFVTAGHLPG